MGNVKLFLSDHILDMVMGIHVYTYPRIDSEDVEVILPRPTGFQVYEVVNSIDLEYFVLDEVSNIAKNCGEGTYVYVVEKVNVDTINVCNLLRGLLKCSSCDVLGLKDANALVRQVVILRRCRKSKVVVEVRNRDSYIKAVLWQCDPEALVHNGNKFVVEIITNNLDVIRKRLEMISRYGYTFLNFFGYQRYGTRNPLTHLLGKMVIKNEWESFIELICESKSGYKLKAPEKVVCRERLRYEDVLKVVKLIPKNLVKLYVNAYQSYLFNKLLSLLWLKLLYNYEFEEALKLMIKEYKFLPVVGSRMGVSAMYKNEVKVLLDEILSLEDVSVKDFNIESLGLEVVGDIRSTFAKADMIRITVDRNSLKLSFTLDRGCYATMFLREILRVNPLLYT